MARTYHHPSNDRGCGKVIVKWWGEENYSAIAESKGECLSQNKIDEHQATRSTQIAKAYHSALSETLSDVKFGFPIKFYIRKRGSHPYAILEKSNIFWFSSGKCAQQAHPFPIYWT